MFPEKLFHSETKLKVFMNSMHRVTETLFFSAKTPQTWCWHFELIHESAMEIQNIACIQMAAVTNKFLPELFYTKPMRKMWNFVCDGVAHIKYMNQLKNRLNDYCNIKECRSIVRDETLYLTMLSAVTPTQWVFYIISVLPHMHIFTDVSMFGCF